MIDVDKIWDDVYTGSGRTLSNYAKLKAYYGRNFMSWDDFVNDRPQ